MIRGIEMGRQDAEEIQDAGIEKMARGRLKDPNYCNYFLTEALVVIAEKCGMSDGVSEDYYQFTEGLIQHEMKRIKAREQGDV